MVSLAGVSSGHPATAVDNSNLAAVFIERMSVLKSALPQVFEVRRRKEGANSRAVDFAHQGINFNWNALMLPNSKDELNDFFTKCGLVKLT